MGEAFLTRRGGSSYEDSTYHSFSDSYSAFLMFDVDSDSPPTLIVAEFSSPLSGFFTIFIKWSVEKGEYRHYVLNVDHTTRNYESSVDQDLTCEFDSLNGTVSISGKKLHSSYGNVKVEYVLSK